MYIHSRHVNLELLQQKGDVFSHLLEFFMISLLLQVVVSNRRNAFYFTGNKIFQI